MRAVQLPVAVVRTDSAGCFHRQGEHEVGYHIFSSILGSVNNYSLYHFGCFH